MPQLTVATCQFLAADIDANLRWVARQVRIAAQRGAKVVHFPEGALSGYAGSNFESFADFRWEQLASATDATRELAREFGVWVAVGTAPPIENRKPFNSVYVISDAGVIVERYDKRFCSGDEDQNTGDLANYAAGDHPSVWEIDGVPAGALICHDYRYPELYREYKRLGVELVVHSFHAANVTAAWLEAAGREIGEDLRRLNPAATFTYPGITMPAAMTTAAADNHVWISWRELQRPGEWLASVLRAR
jgi:predicted amidohydrolase